MKKTVLILVVVAALVGLVFYANKKTKLQNASASAPAAATSTNGKSAPLVAMKNLEGKDVSLADYKGKVVLVNFWATWCDPCRIEIPWLINMQNKYSARGFTILGVAMDDDGRSVVPPFL